MTSQRVGKRSLQQQESAVSSPSTSLPVIGPTLVIRCGSIDALLDLSRFDGGGSAPCIVLSPAAGGSSVGVTELISPQAFQERTVCQTFRDWQRSIKHHGVTIQTLLSSGILTTASRDSTQPPTCSCDKCLAVDKDEDGDLPQPPSAKRRSITRATTGKRRSVDGVDAEGEGRVLRTQISELETGVTVDRRRKRRGSIKHTGNQTAIVDDNVHNTDIAITDSTHSLPNISITCVEPDPPSHQSAESHSNVSEIDSVQSPPNTKTLSPKVRQRKQLETSRKTVAAPSGFSHRPTRSVTQKSNKNHNNEAIALSPSARPVRQHRLVNTTDVKSFATKQAERTVDPILNENEAFRTSSRRKNKTVLQQSSTADNSVPESYLPQELTGGSVDGEVSLGLLPVVTDQRYNDDDKLEGRDMSIVLAMTDDDTCIGNTEDNLSRNETGVSGVSDSIPTSPLALGASTLNNSDHVTSDQPISEELTLTPVSPAGKPCNEAIPTSETDMLIAATDANVTDNPQNDTNNNSKRDVQPPSTVTDDPGRDDGLLTCVADNSGESRIKNIVEELRSRKRFHFKADKREKRSTAPLSSDSRHSPKEAPSVSDTDADVVKDATAPVNITDPTSMTLTFTALGQLQHFAAERTRNLEMQASTAASSAHLSPSPVVALATLRVPDVSWKPVIGRSSPMTTATGSTSSLLASIITNSNSNMSKSSSSDGLEYEKDGSGEEQSSNLRRGQNNMLPRTAHQGFRASNAFGPSSLTQHLITPRADRIGSVPAENGNSKVGKMTLEGSSSSNRNQNAIKTGQLRQFGPGIVTKFKVKDKSEGHSKTLTAKNNTSKHPMTNSGRHISVSSPAVSTIFNSKSTPVRPSLQHQLHHYGTGNGYNNKQFSAESGKHSSRARVGTMTNDDWLLNIPVPKVGSVKRDGVTMATQPVLSGRTASSSSTSSPHFAHSTNNNSSNNRHSHLTFMHQSRAGRHPSPSSASTMRRYSDSNYWHQRTLFGGDASEALPLDYTNKTLQELTERRLSLKVGDNESQALTNWRNFDTDSSGAIDLSTSAQQRLPAINDSDGETGLPARSKSDLSQSSSAAAAVLDVSSIQLQPKSVQVHPCQQWL